MVVQRADLHADGLAFEIRTPNRRHASALKSSVAEDYLLHLFPKNFTVYPLCACAKPMQHVKQQKYSRTI